MAVGDDNTTRMLTTGRNERMKTYIAYDSSDRMEYVYEAAVGTAHGKPCLRTQYAYAGVSTRIVKMKETEATWDSAYEIV